MEASGIPPSSAVALARYEKRARLGQGAYATVRLAIDKESGKEVAIKKISVGNTACGVNLSALREIASMRELCHPNVLQLLDVFIHRGSVRLVLEFLVTDLEKVIKDMSISLRTEDVKSWMLMTLRGVHHCHAHFLLHRDLKPNNLLIDSRGVLKVADFGLARFLPEPGRQLTPEVVTRFYRAPELLFGARSYGPAVDIWSVGCIFGELMLRTPYLAGKDSDFDQLDTIFRARGTPSEDEWPDVKSLPGYVAFGAQPKPPLSTLFTAAAPDALALLDAMLRLNPMQRVSAEGALRHPYFTNSPMPTKPSELRLPATPAETAALKRKAQEEASDRPAIKRLVF